MLATTVTSKVFSFDAAVGSTSPHQITIVFDKDIGSTLAASELVVDNVTTDTQLIGDFTLSYNSGTKTAVFKYDPDNNASTLDVLPDGNYTASLGQTDVSAYSGGTYHYLDQPMSLSFFVLSGDMSDGSTGARDRRVNIDDLLTLIQSYNTTGKTYSQGNVNYDTSGNVNSDDLFTQSQLNGKILAAPATTPTSISVSTLETGTATLSWMDTTTGETGFRVQVSDDGYDWTELNHKNTRENRTSLTITGLTPGKKYWFRVRAFSDAATNPNGANSEYTTKSSVVIKMDAPVITSWSEVATDIYEASWTPVNGASGYIIYDLTDPENPVYLDEFGSGEAGYEFDAANNSPIDMIGIAALNAAYQPTTIVPLSIVAPPANLTVAPDSSGDFVLNWTNVGGEATSYSIQRRHMGSSWAQVGTTASSAVTYTDTSSSADGTWYQYRIVPVKSGYTDLPSGPVVEAIKNAVPISTAPSLGTVATVAEGADGSDPASLAYSPDTGVRYADGTLRYETTDLMGKGLGRDWGVTRSWTNNAGNYGGEQFGTGWMINQQPFLKQISSDELQLVLSGSDSINFVRVGSTPVFVAKVVGTSTDHLRGDTITEDDTEYRLGTTDGGILIFNAFGGDAPGHLKTVQGVGGMLFDENGREQLFAPEYADGEKYQFTWTELSGKWRVTSIQMLAFDQFGIPSTDVWRTAEYSYYGINDANGNAGDLKKVVVYDGENTDPVIDRKYYRYYKPGQTGGYAGGLKMAFDADSYARLAYNVGSPESSPDATVDDYADIVLEYDLKHRVTKAVVQGKGSSWSDGRGTYTYSYSTSSNSASNPLAWIYKTVETRPNGDTDTVYANSMGHVLLSRYTDSATSQSWRTYHEYDSAGRRTLTAMPSAVTNDYEASTGSLLDQPSSSSELDGMKDNDGLVYTFEYQSTTTSPIVGEIAGTVESVTGRLAYDNVRRGENSGSVQRQNAYEYQAFEVEATTATVIASSSVYEGAGATNERKTLYTYTPHLSGGSAVMVGSSWLQSYTVTLPNVATANNGENATATRVTHLDSAGRVDYMIDEEGAKTAYEYDAYTGAITSITVDSDGLALETQFLNIDEAGRATKIVDPNGNVTFYVFDDERQSTKVYPGFHYDGSDWKTTGPIQYYRVNRAKGFTESLEYVPESITLNGSDEPTGAESIGSTMTSLKRGHYGLPGLLTQVETYHALSGISYSDTTFSLGTLGTNRYSSFMDYDEAGRLVRSVNNVGTVTRYVLNGPGHVLSKWIGTGDNPEDGDWNDESDEVGFQVWNAGTQTYSESTTLLSNNMRLVTAYDYDDPNNAVNDEEATGIGDGNVTAIYQFTDATNGYVSYLHYDWRNRLVGVRNGVATSQPTTVNRPYVHYSLDNLSRATQVDRYDGDTVGSITYTNGVPQAPASSLLRARATYSYDERGDLFRTNTFDVDQSSGSDEDGSLTTNYWFNGRGQTIKTKAAGGLVTKYSYDTAGRLEKSYITDGLSDSGYGHAKSVSDDHILEQNEFTLDKNGNIVFQVLKQASHISTATGEIGDLPTRPTTAGGSNTTGAARVYSTAYAYDAAGRMTRSVAIGANDGYLYDQDLASGSPSWTIPQRETLTGTASGGSYTLGTAPGFAGSTTSAFDNYFAGWKVKLTSINGDSNASGVGEIRTVTAYDSGTNKLSLSSGLPYTGGSFGSFTYELYHDYLVTDYAYGPSGYVDQVTDPKGIVSKTDHDAMGRVTQTVEAYVDGTPSDADDRTTLYEYDGLNHVTMLTALLSGGYAYQQTQYVFGVSAVGSSASSYFSNDLLKQVLYPNVANGTPSSAETMSYNRQGQTNTYQDRNGTIHSYGYDTVGRLSADTATTIGSGVNNTIKRLGYGYDALGNTSTFSSYSDTDGSTLVNQVTRAYDSLGRLLSEQQNDGALSGTVSFAYGTSGDSLANGGRLRQMTYPNGRKLHYGYDSVGGNIDDSISRLSYLADDNGSGSPGTHLEDLDYLGLSTIVKRGHAESGVDWSLAMNKTGVNPDVYSDPFSSTDYVRNPGDLYTGIDNHGRVKNSRWESVNGSGVFTANQDDFIYGYDKNGNRLYRDNGLNDNFDELYHADDDSLGYDKLDRLTEFQRGALSDSDSDGFLSINTSSRSQNWSLDALGNWSSLTQSGGGSNETRAHDFQNGITAINGNALAYSNNGELLSDNAGQTYVYDAWGRLVSVDPDGAGSTAATTYSYDALFRRITEDADGTGTGQPTVHLYYTPAWQVIEEREGTSTTAKTQQVWSPIYVDALVLRDDDFASGGNLGNSGSGLDRRVYFMQDANFNVTGLIGLADHDNNPNTAMTWGVIERYIYDPYGKPTVLDANWASDADGASDIGNRNLHQGGRYTGSLQLAHFRYRDLHVSLGRWNRQDPLGYVDGSSLLSAYGESPITMIDPEGLFLNIAIRNIATRNVSEAESAGHRKRRPSTREDHEKGDERRKRDKGGEKGDERRRPPRQRPPGHKGPWPPRPKAPPSAPTPTTPSTPAPPTTPAPKAPPTPTTPVPAPKPVVPIPVKPGGPPIRGGGGGGGGWAIAYEIIWAIGTEIGEALTDDPNDLPIAEPPIPGMGDNDGDGLPD